MLKKKISGFTLIELLITITIVALLTLMVIFGLSQNLGKARDSRRKADLERIKTAFEEYYGNESIYPPVTILDNCGGEELKPYLNIIPCDPKTKKPYCYIYEPNGQNYRLLSSLENISDTIIASLGCDSPTEFCGYEPECIALVGYNHLNYGVSSSNILVANELIGTGLIEPTPTPSTSPSTSPTATPSISPSPSPFPSTIPGNYACNNPQVGLPVCGIYSDPVGSRCGLTFSDEPTCQAYCPTSPIEARCQN